MPFIANTPEALLGRNDSKNPATTCKGITTNGRPCRRALAAPTQVSPAPSPGRSPGPSPHHGRGVLAVLTGQDHHGSRAAAFYCWQHQDQAEHLIAGNQHETEVLQLNKKSSIDTLVDRLGILDLDEPAFKNNSKKYGRQRPDDKPVQRRDRLPQAWHDMPGPLMTVPEVAFEGTPLHTGRPPRPSNGRPRRAYPRSNVTASFLCCIRAVDDDDDDPLPRRHGRDANRHHEQRLPNKSHHRPADMVQRSSTTNSASIGLAQDTTRRKPVALPQHRNCLSPAVTPSRPPFKTPNPSSHTQSLLSLIPSTLPPQTASVLLNELARPISTADEAGYIYMFWLTPSDVAQRPDDDVASSLLALPTTVGRDRRGSDALQAFAQPRCFAGISSLGSKISKTVLLKIGRAANVHRRLNQWTRQCAYNVTLIRYYPYEPSSAGNAAHPGSARRTSSSTRQVPHVHRVERLVHLELGNLRAKNMSTCDSCGREHREWFEVEATREGLKRVDEVIRRWVDWAEQQHVV